MFSGQIKIAFKESFGTLFALFIHETPTTLQTGRGGIMKVNRIQKDCGTFLQKPESVPAREVLNDHGEIFSCGGVYLGLNRSAVPFNDKFEYLFLPNQLQDVLVLNNRKIHRLPGRFTQEGILSPQERTSTQETLRRFFKESLN